MDNELLLSIHARARVRHRDRDERGLRGDKQTLEEEKTIDAGTTVCACLIVCVQWYQSPSHDLMSYKRQSKNLEDVASSLGAYGASPCLVPTESAL